MLVLLIFNKRHFATYEDLSLKLDSCSGGQDISHFYETRMFITIFTVNSSLISIFYLEAKAYGIILCEYLFYFHSICNPFHIYA
jgi:hypothetical protein